MAPFSLYIKSLVSAVFLQGTTQLLRLLRVSVCSTTTSNKKNKFRYNPQSTLPKPNIIMCPQVLSHLCLSVCVCTTVTDIWSRSSFQVMTWTFLSADVGKTINHRTHILHAVINSNSLLLQFWLQSLHMNLYYWF